VRALPVTRDSGPVQDGREGHVSDGSTPPPVLPQKGSLGLTPQEYQRGQRTHARGRGATLSPGVRPPLPDLGVIEFL
jgi:hypothetical protein